LENNADYLTFIKINRNSKLMLKWQKSMNVPDLNVGAAGTQEEELLIMKSISFGIPFLCGKKIKEM
jgi:cobalt-zinc-cadmium efflux system outer membrane protein